MQDHLETIVVARISNIVDHATLNMSGEGAWSTEYSMYVSRM